MKEEKTYIIKSKNNFFSIFFLLLVSGGLLIGGENLALALKLLLVCIVTYSIYWLLWYLIGKYKLQITNEKLIVTRIIIGLKLRRTFEIKKIRQFKYLENEDSIFYWNLGGLILPENNPMIIEFEYLDRKVSIGKECKKFEALEIFNEINKKKYNNK